MYLWSLLRKSKRDMEGMLAALKGDWQGEPSCSIRSMSSYEVRTMSYSNLTSMVVAYVMGSCYSIIIT